MGSSSSSHVKNIQLDQKQATDGQTRSTLAKERRGGSVRHTSFRGSKVSNEVDPTEISPQKVVPQKEDDSSSNAVKQLEKQLTESESQRLDLEDRVQTLEERLEYYNNQNVLQEENTCEETLHAKDQYIAKLEKEKADLEVESNKMKQRSRKKIKMLSSKFTEFKQEANFQMMELREEIARFKEQNLTLQETSVGHKAMNSSEGEATGSVPGGGKMELILELSAQVTEQNEKISKLERKLKDKDQIVDELRVKLKNNMEYLKARDEVDNFRNGSSDKNNNNGSSNKSGQVHQHNQSYSRKNAVSSRKTTDSAVKNAESSRNDVNSLFAVTEEDSDNDFDDADKMVKLNALLKGVKAKSDTTRHSTDSLDDKLSDPDDLLVTKKEGEMDARKFSGTSRDSGVGSAGKQRKAQNNSITNFDQKEPSFSFESGLSDSSPEDNYSHSKISSAPPTFGKHHPGQKLKKKSSLKRRASQKNDRPHIPKPGLAFVNNNDHEPVLTDDIFKIPGSSLSSVQVS